MSIYARLIAAIVAAVVLLGAGYRMGIKIKQGEWDASVVAGKDAQDKALSAAADRIAQITVKNQTIIQRVTRETIEKPVFRECRSGPDAVRLLNAAAGHTDDKPASQSELPASSATD